MSKGNQFNENPFLMFTIIVDCTYYMYLTYLVQTFLTLESTMCLFLVKFFAMILQETFWVTIDIS